MKEEVVVHGVVLSEHSQREFDKRLHVLTMEEGKMTVWASGAKRPSSPLMAGSRSFVFGTFSLKKGKSGYNLQSVKVDAYFEEIALDLEKACYAAYFLELADFVSQENLLAEELVNLIYLSLKALLHKNLSNEMVRAIYELRLLKLEGEYTEKPPRSEKNSVLETWNYVLTSPLNKLYTFTLEEGTLLDFCGNVEWLLRESFPVQFHSLRILKSLKQ